MILIIGEPFLCCVCGFFVFNFAMTLTNNGLGTIMFNLRFVNCSSFFDFFILNVPNKTISLCRVEEQHWGLTIIKLLKVAGLLLFVFLFCCNVTELFTGQV